MKSALARDAALVIAGALLCLQLAACQASLAGAGGGADTGGGANATDGGTGLNGLDGDGSDTTAECPANPLVTAVTIYANYDNGVRIGVGESITLKAVVTYSADPDEPATACWESAATDTATVTADDATSCTLRGVAVGETTVTASVGSIGSAPLLIKVQSGGLIPGTP